ncbi:MAG TPA: cation:proton antiporter [Candidatus Nanopelagicaceae bacterium]
MSIGLLGALVFAGICGPLLAIPKKYGVPVAAGEILIGVLLGRSGFDVVPTTDPTLVFFSSIGFALVMMTAGSHVNFRTLVSRKIISIAAKILFLNLVVSLAIGVGISHLTNVHNWKLLSLVMFSSSAAFVVPLITNFKRSVNLSVLLAQVTLADCLSFIYLPFLTQNSNGSSALLGAFAVMLFSLAFYLFLKVAKDKGWIALVRKTSKRLNFGLELRISLGILLLASAMALRLHSSLLVAGFSLGVVLASVGVPRRLARQLFAVSDGFFAPIFFLWLGAEINIRDTFHDRNTLLLALFLVLGAFLVHISAIVFGQSLKFSIASTAQLGIPAAAVTLGSASGILSAGQSGAIMLSALITLLVSSFVIKNSEVAQ